MIAVDGNRVTPAAKPPTPSVSVVICAYTEDRFDDLSDAVESARAQTLPPLEVIVVSDHNRELADRVRNALRDVIVVENREQRGLSGARNTGVAAARGDVIAFLDDDAVAAPDWLERLIDAYRDDAVVGVGGAVESRWVSGRPTWFPTEFDWVVGCSYRGLPKQTTPVRNAIGANMSFRRRVFDSVGGFRSGIGRVGTRPVGCEETELSLRVHERWPEAAIVYEPAARVRHTVPESRASWRYFVSRCYAEGLSKALVAAIAGSSAGLSAERDYTRRTLPQGFGHGLVDAIGRRELGGAARAGAIAIGLGATVAGYAVGTLRRRAGRLDGVAGTRAVEPTHA